jgi:hypothetical protein
LGAELAAVVGDDEPGRAALFDRVFDQRDHVACRLARRVEAPANKQPK